MYNICLHLQICINRLCNFFSTKKNSNLVEIKHEKMDEILLEHYLIYPNKQIYI